jgi:hypothetical protein
MRSVDRICLAAYPENPVFQRPSGCVAQDSVYPKRAENYENPTGLYIYFIIEGIPYFRLLRYRHKNRRSIS